MIDLKVSFRQLGALVIFMLAFGCEQKVVLKDYSFTGVNPVAYTDVVFKSARDTAFVSTFDGKIYEIINGETQRRPIAEIDDEIYDMVFEPKDQKMYLATLNSGVVVLGLGSGEILRKLQLKATWGHELIYNGESGLLATNDFSGNSYLWDTRGDFDPVEIPAEYQDMRLRKIDSTGVYFQGQGKIVLWNKDGNGNSHKGVSEGKLRDVDALGNYLFLSGKEFSFLKAGSDSVQFRKKHLDWPVYIADADSMVHVPLSLELLDGKMTDQDIITVGLDKTIRFWDKNSGELNMTHTAHRASISAMAINKDQSQMVSVDLGGNAIFMDING